MWFTAFLIPIYFLIHGKSKSVFDTRLLSCTTTIPFHHPEITLILFIAFALIPVILTILLNIFTLVYNFIFCTTHNTSNLNGLVTVLVICWVFIISWIPYVIRTIMTIRRSNLPLWFYTIQCNLNILSLAPNPFVYTATNHSFRKFCYRKLRSFSRSNLKYQLSEFGNKISTPRFCGNRNHPPIKLSLFVNCINEVSI